MTAGVICDAQMTGYREMAVKGFVEDITTNGVVGWAYDRNGPVKIRVCLNGSVIAEGSQNVDRPDVSNAVKADGRFGFSIPIPIAPDDIDKVTVQVATDKKLSDLSKLAKERRSYQDFDGTGGSKSHEKLKALRLADMAFGEDLPHPLHGKSVLDLGCNEGFFCGEALRQGATRVLGFDVNKDYVASAKARFPQAEFVKGSWWDIPDEKFDVIFFLSAIHYEPEQKKLLDKLADHLTDRGVLILECGVHGNKDSQQWHAVTRWDGEKRYPSPGLLERNLLSKYATRLIGHSVAQAGDPVPRFVYHCRPKRPTALIISGQSHDGKTSLANTLEQAGLPVYRTDIALRSLVFDPDDKNPLSKELSQKFEPRANLAMIGDHVAESDDLVPRFCEKILSELPLEAGTVVIEGEVLRHESVLDALVKALKAAKVRPWLMSKQGCAPVNPPTTSATTTPR